MTLTGPSPRAGKWTFCKRMQAATSSSKKWPKRIRGTKRKEQFRNLPQGDGGSAGGAVASYLLSCRFHFVCPLSPPPLCVSLCMFSFSSRAVRFTSHVKQSSSLSQSLSHVSANVSHDSLTSCPGCTLPCALCLQEQDRCMNDTFLTQLQ